MIRSAVVALLIAGGVLAVGVAVLLERLRWAAHVRCDVCGARRAMGGCYAYGWRYMLPDRGRAHWRCPVHAAMAPQGWVA